MRPAAPLIAKARAALALDGDAVPAGGMHDPAARRARERCARPPGSVGVTGPSPVAAFEQRQRESAPPARRRGRLAEAALAWEILTVLRPDSAEYRDRLTDTQRLIDAAVADRSQRAVQATSAAISKAHREQYLAVLALQPDQAQAAEALRSIERERNRRNHLGKFSRISLTREAARRPRWSSMPPMAAPPRPSGQLKSPPTSAAPSALPRSAERAGN